MKASRPLAEHTPSLNGDAGTHELRSEALLVYYSFSAGIEVCARLGGFAKCSSPLGMRVEEAITAEFKATGTNGRCR